MIRSRGFRVNLAGWQADKLYALVGAQREAYNWAVSRLKDDPTLTRFDLQKEFTTIRQATPHLRQTERLFQNTAIHQARTACDISNRYGDGNLKYRTSKKPLRTVGCELAPTYVGNRAVSLPGLGRVSLAEQQPYQYPNNWLYKARSFRLVDVTPWRNTKPSNRIWRLYVTYDLPDPEPRTEGLAVGVDRGIRNPTTIGRSDGSTVCYDTATAFRSNQRWNDETRHQLSKTNKHSRNYRETARRRDRRNYKNACERDYCEWMLAKEVCEGASVICIERLDLEAMTRYGGNRKKGLNRGMRFVRHGEILRKIRVVAERMGIGVIEVNPAGTSITCSRCQHADKESRKDERFECVSCGRVMNADGNASCNIVNKGADINVPAGEGMFLERRELGRTRNPPVWVRAAPDADQRRENQARNRPATSSAEKHLGRYAYVTCAVYLGR